MHSSARTATSGTSLALRTDTCREAGLRQPQRSRPATARPQHLLPSPRTDLAHLTASRKELPVRLRRDQGPTQTRSPRGGGSNHPAALARLAPSTLSFNVNLNERALTLFLSLSLETDSDRIGPPPL
jgi:hypothetical protein